MASYIYKSDKKTPVRKSASTDSKIISSIKKNKKIKVSTLKTTNAGYVWGKVTVDKETGWILISNGKTSTGKITSVVTNADSTVTKTNITKTVSAYNSIYGDLSKSVNGGNKLKRTMQLFGIPYQFLESVDHRVDSVNSHIGRKFIQNIVLDAPVLTIMPGKADYLAGKNKDEKASITNAFINAASGNFSDLAKIQEGSKDELKFYDFATDYMEYMRYVNILCRTCAAYLELDEKKYKINGEAVNFLNYDWKNYRWEGQNYQGSVSKVVSKGIKNAWDSILNAGGNILSLFTGSQEEKGKKDQINTSDSTADMSDEEKETLESLLRNVHYVQFYIDPSSQVGENISNETTQSSIKSSLDSASSSVKEFLFMADSAGTDIGHTLQGYADSLLKAIDESLGDSDSGISTIVSRVTGMANNIIQGENIIMPDIYSNSSYSKSYSFTVHLKTPYGTKYAYYMDILVPLMHLLALGLPKASSANSFNSPFLVKCFQGSVFTCNLGIVESISISKTVTNESWNVDGLCTEMDVSLNIKDLYSDLTMTPSNDPVLFMNNTSLLEYLGVSCGLNLIESQFSTKVSLLWETAKNSIFDVGDNVMGDISEKFDDILYGYTGL